MAFNIIEDTTANIFRSFAPDVYKVVREGIIRCILATDMARHNEILGQFNQIVPIFDYDNRAHINLVCTLHTRTYLNVQLKLFLVSIIPYVRTCVLEISIFTLY